MEASPLPTPDTENWAEQFDQTLTVQRDRVRTFLAAQQQRLRQVEAALDEQLRQLADELAKSRKATHHAREDVQQRAEQLARETETFASIKADLIARRAEWEEIQQRINQQQAALADRIERQQQQLDGRYEELSQRQPEIEAAEAKLHRDRCELETARREYETQRDQLAALQSRLEAAQADLDAQRRRLADAKAQTESQRRRIARQFRTEHAAHLQELDRRKAELQRKDEAEKAELRRQLELARRREAESTAELESLAGKCGRIEKELQQRPSEAAGDAQQIGRLEADRNMLRVRMANTEQCLVETQERLEEAQRRLSEMPAGGAADEEDDDNRRRYEMALEDLRELKAENAELQQQLAKARSSAPRSAAAVAAGGTLDWEAEKRRILASLEDNSDDAQEDEEAAADRMRIEEVIETTDRLLAEKDLEIADLKQLLQSQSGQMGSMALGAAALGQMLDNDAVILEERENLKRLQTELQEKLRRAEVDISMERAKIARERVKLDEKLRVLEERGGETHSQEGDTNRGGAPVRGRWLARLGLKDLEEPR